MNLLKNLSLFNGFTDEELNQISPLLTTVSYNKGDFIIHEGDTVDNIYIIMDGEVAVLKKSETTTEQLHIATLPPTTLIGEISLFDKSPRSASIRALTNVTVASLSINELFKLAKSDSMNTRIIYYKIIENISQQLAIKLQQMNQLTIKLLYKELLAKERDAAHMNIFASFFSF